MVTIMKKSTFYLLWGIVAIVLIALFYVFVQIRMPLLILIAVAVAILAYFLLRKKLTKEYMDERQSQIEMKTSSLTMKIAAAAFAIVNIAIAVYAFGIPHMIMPKGPFAPPEQVQTITLGNVAIIELVLLVVMFFVYVAFHIYYEHKYGGDLKDEE